MKHSIGTCIPAAQRGMTLVEVMVGLVIGLIGMLVILQTVTVWDARTRATSAGSDSQVTGTIAMYNLERDLRLAGQGFGTADPTTMGCQVAGYDANASAAKVPFPMTPVLLFNNDATNSPDQIITLYGTSPYFTTDQSYSAGTAHSIGTFDRTGFKAGDLAVVANTGNGAPASADCQLVEITDDSSAVNAKTLSFNVTSYPHYYQNGNNLPSRFNDAPGLPGASFPSGKVFSFGPVPHRNVWTVASGVLGKQDDLQASAYFPIAEGVIDLKAEYGYDADNDKVVGAAEWSRALVLPIDWTRVRAIRVALLVRSRNYEKPGVVSSSDQNYMAPNPQWHMNGGATSVPFAMRNVDGTADAFVASQTDPSPNNWRNYRYTVYEKVFPLRNVIWGQ